MSILTQDPMRDVLAAQDFQSAHDIPRARKGLLAETRQAMVEGELETHRGCPKHQTVPQPTPNRRHGRRPKPVTTKYGEMA